MKRAILCIFAKPPVAGKVKTRLIPYLSAEQAATLAAAFLEDVASACTQIPQSETIIATVGAWPEKLSRPKGLDLWQQGEGDLGERMETILSRALQEAPAALAIGADVPLISHAILEDALQKLESHDAVIGPSEDGGYYLLGLKHTEPGLLAKLPWSQPHTREATAKRLRSLGYTIAETQTLFDIDTPVELKRLNAEQRCHATRRVLDDIGQTS